MKLVDFTPNKYLQLQAVTATEEFSDLDDMPFEEAIRRLKE
jgi:hypothetical protein